MTFKKLMTQVAEFCQNRQLDADLQQDLEQQFPSASKFFQKIELSCLDAIADGKMCTQGAHGRRFGRVIEAGAKTFGFSVDVVELENIVGPHHSHPKGEICMVIPLTKGATFDDVGRGWKVFAPGSAHHPTVKHGTAIVVYMLPDGEIEFTAPSQPK